MRRTIVKPERTGKQSRTAVLASITSLKSAELFTGNLPFTWEAPAVTPRSFIAVDADAAGPVIRLSGAEISLERETQKGVTVAYAPGPVEARLTVTSVARTKRSANATETILNLSWEEGEALFDQLSLLLPMRKMTPKAKGKKP